MNTITAIRNRILQLCEERNLTINKLATISAVSPSSLKSILYGNSNNPKILTLKMLCDGLDITLAEFFDTPEFNTLEHTKYFFFRGRFSEVSGLFNFSSARREFFFKIFKMRSVCLF